MATAVQRQVWVRRAAVVTAAALVALIAYMLITGGDDNAGSKQVIAGNAAKVRDLAAGQDHSVYWAGSKGAQSFEWTELPDGRVYVRYLTGGAQAGDPRPQFLTIGTYPVGDGIAALNRAGRGSGTKTIKVTHGGTVLRNKTAPTSVYLAYPGSQYEIEVFDPNPQRALALVKSGKIRPVH